MNLRFLETFLWVARLNSFSAAAERLNTTQAAISHRIAALERDLGTRLFERDLRGVRLTEAGRAALDRAGEIVRLAREFRDSVSRPEHRLQGRLTIGTIDSVVYAWLPQLIRRVGETYPAVQLDLAVDTSLGIAGQFARHEIDLALIMGPVIAPDVESRHLCHLGCSWYASPKLGLPEGRLPLAAIAAHPLFAFSRGSQPHQEVLRQLAEAGIVGSTVYNLNSILTMLVLAQDGSGIALLPDVVVPAAVAAGHLRRLDVTTRLPPLDIHAAFSSNPRNVIAAAVAAMAMQEAAALAGANGVTV
jgi:DNA-binding transcriptional LysR family regulator